MNNKFPWSNVFGFGVILVEAFVCISIYSFVNGNLGQTGRFLWTFDMKLSIIWLVINCFIRVVSRESYVFTISTQLAISNLYHIWSWCFMITYNHSWDPVYLSLLRHDSYWVCWIEQQQLFAFESVVETGFILVLDWL